MIRDIERTIEFEFVRATENAALNSMHWLGRGEKEKADAAACDAVYGVFDLIDMRGECMIGEGIKDDAPGIFLGDHLGQWRPDSPRFDIAIDPIDGTSNIAKGLPNSISVIGASFVPEGKEHVIRNIPSYYVQKMAYGPQVVAAMQRLGINNIKIDNSVEDTLMLVASALGKRLADLVIVVLDRPRNQPIIDQVRAAGASLRMVSDGDITAAVAPSLPDSGVDLYLGIGGTPEGILTALALQCSGGDIQMRMWFRDEAERAALRGTMSDKDLMKVYSKKDVVDGDSALFCATGISDSPLLPGVKMIGKTAITHSILMRAKSRTVRYIRAVHNLEHKTIPTRSEVRHAI